MTDSVKEQLSACLDGELPEAELDLLLKRLDREAELKESLGRYSLITQVLQTKAPVAASSAFAGKVMAQLETEALPGKQRRLAAGAVRWLRPVAGLAVAAGVAAVAVLSLQPKGIEQPQTVAVVPTVIEPADTYTTPVGSSPTTASLIPATRLTNYVVAHSEYSSPLGRRAVLSGVLADDEAEETDGTLGTDDDTVVITTDPAK